MTGGLADHIGLALQAMGDAPAAEVTTGTELGPDLLRRCDDWQARLLGQGITRGCTLGWLGLNSADLVAALLACARLGARFVPLNGRLAAAELRAIAAHAGLDVWHADESLAHVLGAPPRRLPAAAGVAGGPADDLLLVYTSGTTAAPKGAVHTQAAMLANLDAAIEAQGLSAHSRVLAVLPLFHVGGLCIQTLPALAVGAKVLLHPRFEPDTWFDAVATWRPTTTLLVPAVMRALIEHPRWAGADLSSLAFVNSGSQIVPRALIQAFHARGVPVAQVYGATETGPVSIVLKPDEAMAHPGMAGRPALGVQLRLAADGEIWLKAPQLMRGYHHSADSGFDAEGWFHTGDLAQQHPDGMFEVVGRSKELIISGGENIHPAEIEQLVAERPDVAECAVVGLPDARWGEVPALVVVPRPGQEIDLAALQSLFDARLARFKHPQRIVVAASLPRTALGKVRRAALAAQFKR